MYSCDDEDDFNKISFEDLFAERSSMDSFVTPFRSITDYNHEEQSHQPIVVVVSDESEEEEEGTFSALSSKLPACAYGNSDMPTPAGYSPSLIQETQSEEEVEDHQPSFVGVALVQNSQHVRRRTNIDAVKSYWLNAYFDMVKNGKKNKKKAAFEIARSPIAFGYSEEVILTYLYNLRKDKKFMRNLRTLQF